MNTFLIWITVACYLGTAVQQVVAGNLPLAVVFAAYGIANVGMILTMQ